MKKLFSSEKSVFYFFYFSLNVHIEWGIYK